MNLITAVTAETFTFIILNGKNTKHKKIIGTDVNILKLYSATESCFINSDRLEKKQRRVRNVAGVGKTLKIDA